MDAATHVLVAFALAAVAARAAGAVGAAGAAGRQWGPVAGLAAFAPDLDVVFAPLLWFDVLYPLQHRGATHSIVGAPIMALVVLAAAGALARRHARLEAFRWRRGHWVPLLLGAWSHLLLDAVTHQGTPLLWPVTEARWSLEVYYWIIWWLAPFSLLPLWLRWRGRWGDRRVVQAATLVLVVVLALGALRLAERPDGTVYAQRDPFDWLVASQQGNGTWRVDLVEHGETTITRWYVPEVPAGAGGAVALVQETDAYRGFRFSSTAPHVVTAQPAGQGWDVTVVDIVQRFQATTAPPWAQEHLLKDAGILRAHVDGTRVEVDRPGWL